jgi:hypothetical protein
MGLRFAQVMQKGAPWDVVKTVKRGTAPRTGAVRQAKVRRPPALPR